MLTKRTRVGAVSSEKADCTPAEKREGIHSTDHELDAFDEVGGGIEHLREAGSDVYVLSNGNPELLESMVTHPGIDDLLAGVISADEVERFKPDVELYRAAARTGTPIEALED